MQCNCLLIKISGSSYIALHDSYVNSV